MSCMTMCMTGYCGIQVPVRYSYISTSYYYSHKFRAALYCIEIRTTQYMHQYSDSNNQRAGLRVRPRRTTSVMAI